MTEPNFDHEKLDVYWLSVHDRLTAFAAIDEAANRQGKSRLKRVVSMLTRLTQREPTVVEDAIEYEYEYREAEYEPDSRVRPEQRRDPERPKAR